MQIIVIAGFVVSMSLVGLAAPWASYAPWWASVLGVVCYVASVYAAARGSASSGMRRLMRGSPKGGVLGRRSALLAAATHVLLVGGPGVLMLAGWAGLINETLHLENVPLVGKAMIVSPFIAALLVYWWAIYPLERAVRDHNRQAMALAGEPVLPTWTCREFLRFNIRCNLLFVAVPVGLIILVLDVLMLTEPMLGRTATEALALAAAGAIFVSVPVIIVHVWRTRPLPAGPLRSRLEGLCRRCGFGCRDILVWDTGGVIVNAAMMGMVRPLRYVLLSDAMLAHMDDEAVAAIFAHEAGHTAGRHIPYMVLFTAGLVLLCCSTVILLSRPAGLGKSLTQIIALLATGSLWASLFGMLSRRFERQADVFAAAMTPEEAGRTEPPPTPPQTRPAELTGEGVDLFSRSLLKVGRLNGIDASRRNFRHGSIAYRLKSLQRLLGAGDGLAATDRGIRRIKLAIWALSALGVALAVAAAL